MASNSSSDVKPVPTFETRVGARLNSGDLWSLSQQSSPEKRLLHAILVSGLCAACEVGQHLTYSSGEKQYWRSMARKWISQEGIHCDERNGISFTYACEQLDVDHRALRRAVESFSPSLIEYLKSWREKPRLNQKIAA